MMLTLACETLTRYVLHYDLAGYEDILLITSMWVYMCGAAYQTNREKLICADLTGLFLKNERQLKFVRLAAGAISLFASIFLMTRGYEYFLWVISQSATTPTLRVPLKVVQSSLFIGYIFIVFYNFFILVERLSALLDKPLPEAGGAEV